MRGLTQQEFKDIMKFIELHHTVNTSSDNTLTIRNRRFTLKVKCVDIRYEINNREITSFAIISDEISKMIFNESIIEAALLADNYNLDYNCLYDYIMSYLHGRWDNRHAVEAVIKYSH